jgi:hypothetical protein
LDFIRWAVDHEDMTTASSSSIVLRRAVSSDTAALDRLAQLDSMRLPGGPHLLAERDGAVIAAFAVRSGVEFADPFTPTADAAELLREWAGRRTARPPRHLIRRPRVAVAS